MQRLMQHRILKCWCGQAFLSVEKEQDAQESTQLLKSRMQTICKKYLILLIQIKLLFFKNWNARKDEE